MSKAAVPGESMFGCGAHPATSTTFNSYCPKAAFPQRRDHRVMMSTSWCPSVTCTNPWFPWLHWFIHLRHTDTHRWRRCLKLVRRSIFSALDSNKGHLCSTVRATMTSSVCVCGRVCVKKQFSNWVQKTKNAYLSLCSTQGEKVLVAPEAPLSPEQQRVQSEEVSYVTAVTFLQ